MKKSRLYLLFLNHPLNLAQALVGFLWGVGTLRESSTIESSLLLPPLLIVSPLNLPTLLSLAHLFLGVCVSPAPCPSTGED